MIRKHENPLVIKAGALSVLVHGALLVLLVLSVNFKSAPPVSYSEVELWDTLPNQEPVKARAIPKIEEKIAEPVSEPMIEKTIVEPIVKTIAKQEIKPDIQIKQEVKKPKTEAVKVEKPKKDKDAMSALLAEMATEDNKAQVNSSKKAEKALNQARINTESQGEIDKYKALIAEKIKNKVNKELCSIGNKKITVKISMMATGEVLGAPRVTSGSGSEACDQAIESAVLLAQPLPLPADKELFSQFRDLTLIFKPDE